MNSKKKLLVKCTLTMAMVPFHTYATSGQAGLKACADAMVSELSITNGTAVGYQLNSASEGFDRKLQSFERISLYARDPQSNELVSKMDCVISSKGRVIRLTRLPLEDTESGNRVSRID